MNTHLFSLKPVPVRKSPSTVDRSPGRTNVRQVKSGIRTSLISPGPISIRNGPRVDNRSLRNVNQRQSGTVIRILLSEESVTNRKMSYA